MGHISFGRAMSTEINIDLLDGKLFVGQRTKGGLGIEVLDIKNRCLLCKWLFKMLFEGVWQELLTNKYLCGKTLSQVQVNTY
jgi:hypothetical protein